MTDHIHLTFKEVDESFVKSKSGHGHVHRGGHVDVDTDTDVETPFSSPERDININTNVNNVNLNLNIHTNRSTEEGEESDTSDVEVQVQVSPEIITSTGSSSSNSSSNSSISQSKSSKPRSKSKSKRKEDYSKWPLVEIKDPHPHDVLYGRGGGTNHHPGNKRYRKLVEGRKVDYVNSKRLDKPLVALEIIKEWRSQKPPGRFLKLDELTGLWHDVGDKKAREKTSQALREKAPLLRKQQEEERKEKATENDKTTRFDVPEKTSKVSKNLSRGVLARDHSLGRDYIHIDEPVSVKGFSWMDPVIDVPSDEVSPQSGSWEEHVGPHGSFQVIAQPEPSVAYAVRGSGTSSASVTGSVSGAGTNSSQNPSNAYDMHGDYPQSSPQGIAYSDWASQTSHHPHAPHTPHTPQSNENIMNNWRSYHSEDVTQKSYGSSDIDYRRSRSEDDHRRGKRDYYHQHPSAPTPTSSNSNLQSNDYTRFANIVGPNNNYMQNWTSVNDSRRAHSDTSYSSSPYTSPDRISTADPYGRMHSWPSSHSPRGSLQTSPQSSMDCHPHSPYYPPKSPRMRSDPYHSVGYSSSGEGLPRPPTVKRDTSHKLETTDIEPTTKRMNRQSSIGRVEPITEKDIKHLKNSLEQSSIVGTSTTSTHQESPLKLKKPQTLGESDRLSTIDRFMIDFESPDSSMDRRSKSKHGGESGSGAVLLDTSDILQRPNTLTDNDRVSTLGTIDSDFFGSLTNTAPV